MPQNTGAERKQGAVYREVVERYCHVIDQNTVIVKTVNGDNSVVSECMNSEKCKLYGGCKNSKFQ